MKTTFPTEGKHFFALKQTSQAVLMFLLFLASIGFAAAQANDSAQVNVRVSDQNKAVLSGAVVILSTRDGRIRLKCVTESSGICRFSQLTSGEYLVEATATGFGGAPSHVLRVEKAGSASLDISLPLSAVSERVVITAQATAQPVDEVSKALSIVEQQEIDERDEVSIAEVLRAVPGLRVQQLGGPGSFSSIKTRGLRNEDTAILIDGLRFRDAGAPQGDASGFIEDLMVTDLSRVEVLRGSGSSLYGTNAIGGVINLVSNEGGGQVHGNVLAEGGSLGMFRGRANLAGGAQNDRLVYSGGFSHLSLTRGVDGHDDVRNSNGQGRLLFQLTPKSTLSGRIYAGNSRLQLNNTPEGVGNLPAAGVIEARALSRAEQRRYESGLPVSQLNLGSANYIAGANDPDNLRKANFVSGAVSFSHRPVEAFGYTLSYHGLATNRTTLNGPLGVGFQPFGGAEQSDFDARVHTFNARFDLQAGLANFITGGYEFENENFTNLSFPVSAADNSTVDVTQRSHALFLQDQLRFMEDRLQISAAFRAQWFSLLTPRFKPTAAPYQGIAFQSPPSAYTGDGSIAYMFRSSRTKLRAHVGNGFRAPSLFERFGTFFSSFFGYSAFGDPRLRPDRSIAVDGGVDQTFAGNRVRVSATYFYTHLQKIIIFDFSGAINPATDPFGRFGGYLNTDGGIARGAELSLTSTPTRSLNLSAAYTFTKSLQRTPQVAGVPRTLGIPDHQFSLVVTQRLGRRVLLNFDLAATSDYMAPIFDPNTFSNRAYSFSGFARADLGGSYTLPMGESSSLRFFGYIDNLFGREYFESGFRTPARTGRAGASLRF